MKNILLLSSILLGSLVSQAQVPFWLPSSGLVGWYPFNGNANDESPWSNNATPNNVTLIQDRFGNSNKAYSFNGITSYIEAPDHSSLRVRKVTMAAWVKPNNSNVFQVVLKGNKNNAYNEAYSLNTNLSGIKINSGCLPGNAWKINDPVKSLYLNTWQLLVSTFDGDTIRTYLNDTLIAQTPANGLIDNCIGGTLRFGYNWDTYKNVFDGDIDDISVYDRALTPCELHRLYYQNHTGITSHPSNTVALTSAVQFSIAAPGTGLSYQWVEESATSTTVLTNGGQYAGANTNTLSISGVTKAMNGNNYYCIVTAPGLCPDSSNKAKLLVPFVDIPHWLPENGLTAWYPLDSDAKDYSTNANHGVTQNITAAADRHGNANKAYSFNGTSSYIEVAGNATLKAKKLTLAAWVKPNTTGLDAILSRNTKGSGQNQTFRLTTEGFGIKQNSNCAAGIGWQQNTHTLTAGSWQLIVATYDGDTMRTYINNALVASKAVSGLIDTCSGGSLLIGYNSDLSPQVFDGTIDDIAVYNRELARCEISRLYSQNHTGITTQPSDAISVNNTAQFSIVAPGTGLSYQWLEISGTSVIALTNGGKYSGVNTNTLTITDLTEDMNSNRYKCIVMAPGLCADSSLSAKLEVPTALKDVRSRALSVYPNPATSVITIKSEALRAGINYYIIDKLGRKVISGITTGHENHVSVQSLPAGLYFLHIEGTGMSTKIYKQ